MPLIFVVAELQLNLSNDARHQASFKFLCVFCYVRIDVWWWDCVFDTFIVDSLLRAVHTYITNGGFTNLPLEGIKSFLLLRYLCLIVNDFNHLCVKHILHLLFKLLLRNICPDFAMQDEVELVAGTS